VADKKSQQPKRRRRLDGEASRTRILDAATEIASERGYEGASIALVSAKCGLPASSIYWHFKDKDDLIAAVIERSFAQWLSAWRMSADGTGRERLVAVAMQIAKAFLDSRDFLRLGLMLALERRPVEPRARAMFLAVRNEAVETITPAIRDLTPGLTDAQVHQLATYAIAGADGLIVAKEIGGDSVDLVPLFEMHANALYDIAVRMVAEGAKSVPRGRGRWPSSARATSAPT
jgi:AcrR family transcriptional regulator